MSASVFRPKDAFAQRGIFNPSPPLRNISYVMSADKTARLLLAMPAAERGRYLAEAAAHAAPLYEADLTLPPEKRELTARSDINDDIYGCGQEKWARDQPV